MRAGSIEYSSFGGLSPSGALRATPVSLRWRVSNPPDVSLICRVAFRSYGVYSLGICIGIGIGVRPCSIVAEFR